MILSATLMAMTTLTACHQAQESTVAQKPIVAAEVQDSKVTIKVKSALQHDEKIKRFNIAVVTLKNDVKLNGLVDQQGQTDYVEQLVRSVGGVHSIHDELSVKQ